MYIRFLNKLKSQTTTTQLIRTSINSFTTGAANRTGTEPVRYTWIEQSPAQTWLLGFQLSLQGCSGLKGLCYNIYTCKQTQPKKIEANTNISNWNARDTIFVLLKFGLPWVLLFVEEAMSDHFGVHSSWVSFNHKSTTLDSLVWFLPLQRQNRDLANLLRHTTILDCTPVTPSHLRAKL